MHHIQDLILFLFFFSLIMITGTYHEVYHFNHFFFPWEGAMPHGMWNLSSLTRD